ncbi:D-alanyl-D-alanine carboxypeptidase family protein [Tropicimonas isoalkanivorans]|uniref:D-alanyl-D-alanine carboxypeptidase n=1 Tax=Tropicimonas isoalkanivorans TaxID=441112 RepID=A0A1I1N7X4_9RHOB|nr:D-alanyl-D-alanine carboxypeptidase family protein [Tropicimonas isoalkanivorans]SFC93707.1 D-alanyl-D-alanine carboxypeptidase [Tropicimonas isoalkanivorans]
MTTSIGGRRALALPVIFVLTFAVLIGTSIRAGAREYAAMVMDARTGEVLYSRNADTRLHPASLTKMMTLYIAFEAVEHGEIGLDTKVKISRKAANEVPSKLGLRAGQTIEFRYLIRAAAVKSANDAATAIGEAVSGNEAAFARRMNRTAKELGMTRTTFKNMNGLTEAGHLSTARDMSILGRHLFYDYPQYYNLFSRRSTDAKLRTVYNTNRKFLAAYEGADGIKTGYTNAAGSNLVASAHRGNTRIITTVFGASSSAARNAKVAELMDMGFQRAPRQVAERKPQLPTYAGNGTSTGAKTIQVARAVTSSMRPLGRPTMPAVAEVKQAALQSGIEAAVALATDEAAVVAEVAAAPAIPKTVIGDAVTKAVLLTAGATSPLPQARPRRLDFAAAKPLAEPSGEQVVVSRVSTSGGRHWGINVGSYPSRYKAERVLLKTALSEMSTLDGALRKVAQRSTGFDANFLGLSEDQAALACRRLEARGAECSTFGPNGS